MWRKKQGGVSLLEMLISISIMGIVLASSYRVANDRTRDIKDQQVAAQHRMILNAGRHWIMDNLSTVQASATAAAPHVLTTATLTAAGYLPSSFSGSNAYGQTYEIKTLEPAANRFEALLVTLGGDPIEAGRIPLVAAMVGQEGGYIPYATGVGNCNATTIACGAFGGWRIAATTNYWAAGSGNPGAGHLASMIAIENGTVTDDFLYRNAVPGQPQLNQMATAIDMNNNNLTNVNTITGQAGALAITGTVTASSKITGTTFWASSAVTDGAACTNSGDMARDVYGATMSCQSSQWRKQEHCRSLAGDLNTVQDAGCYNGFGFTNAPSGDWFFIEVMRHYNTLNYYTIQRATGMTGGVANITWTRSQQSGAPGVGWSAWKLLSPTKAVNFVALVNPGDVINKPSCMGTAANARIFLTPSQVAYSTTGSSLQAVQAWAADNGASWTVHLTLTSAAGGPDTDAAALSAGSKLQAIVKCI